jgi:hypothetical protein
MKSYSWVVCVTREGDGLYLYACSFLGDVEILLLFHGIFFSNFSLCAIWMETNQSLHRFSVVGLGQRRGLPVCMRAGQWRN